MANGILTYLHDGIELTGEDWTNSTHSFDDLVGVIGEIVDEYDIEECKDKGFL